MDYKQKFTIKLIDELGGCFQETIVEGLRERQKFIREWKAGKATFRSDVGDVVVLTKDSGEELWTFVTPTIDQL